MIKTSYKLKTNKEFTHSIGAKHISELLNGIEVYNELSIAFERDEGQKMGVFVPGWSFTYMKGKSDDLLEFRRLISICYSEFQDEWIINLYAVKVENSIKSKNFLIEMGIPILRKWLEEKRNNNWFSGYRYFILGMNEDLTKYCIWETQNDRTINKEIGKNNCA